MSWHLFWRSSGIAAVVCLPVLLDAAFAAEPQDAGAVDASHFPKPAANAASLPGGNWASIAKVPDWQGTWQPFKMKGEDGSPTSRSPVKIKPDSQARFDIVKKLDATGGDKPSRNLHCITRGVPGDMGSAETIFQFGYAPGQVMLVQVEGSVRHIYTDGRTHDSADDLVDTFQGNSIGHWEGQGENATLVVDTIGLDEGNEFISGFAQGPGSHVTERFHLTSPDVLTIDTVLDAPAVLTEPFPFMTRYRRHRDWEPVEFDCAQNNADLDATSGKQIFATPPK